MPESTSSAVTPRGSITRRMAFAVTTLLAAAALSVTGGASAQAAAGNGLASTTLYAYTAPGEILNVSFASTTSLTITRPDGSAAHSCGAGACAFTEAATAAGVWAIEYVRTGDHNTAWRVEVQTSGGTIIDGRVWAEVMSFSNSGFNARTFTAGYLSEYGVIYRATFTGHNGWAFSIRASNRGVMFADGSCRSAYRSVPLDLEAANGPIPEANPADYTLNGGCAAAGLVQYRVFYGGLPASDLPASSTQWADGRTSQQWILPPYQTPTITGVALTRPATGPGGTITGTLTGQSGSLRALIDVDGNGSTSDAIDRVIEASVPVGAFSIPWDGLDGLGATVPRTQAVTITVELTAEAEIHFLESDVEGRTAGIRVTRINGPGAPDSRVSWDDSHLPAPRATVTPVLTGSLVDTSTTSTHQWALNGNGWGNARTIDDWAFIYPSANATISASGAAPTAVTPTPAAPLLAATGPDDASTLLGGALLALLVGTGLALTRRHSARHGA